MMNEQFSEQNDTQLQYKQNEDKPSHMNEIFFLLFSARGLLLTSTVLINVIF